MTAKLLERYKQRISELELVPSSGGRFEIEADGDLLYSKLQEGQFPDETQIVAKVGERVGH